MSGGEVAGVAAAGAASVSFVATGVIVHTRGHRTRVSRAEAAVRPILYEALERGDLDPGVVAGLTPVEQRALDTAARALLPNLRGRDRDTLGRILDHRGLVEAARRQGRSHRAGVRARAGTFLGDSGSPTAVRDLLALLQDPDPQVRWAAARGLGRLGHSSALSPLLSSTEGPRALPVDVVADAVFQIRDCPIAVLRQGLRSQSVPIRAVTVELLGRFQALAAGDEVVRLLEGDPSVEVRARAARALGRMGLPRAVDALLANLDDGPLAMRVQAVWALGEIGDPRTVPVLRALVVGPTRQLAEPAASALAAMGDVGVRVLEQLAEDEGDSGGAAAGALAARAALRPSTS